jgi:hypothetical protein
LQLAVRGRIRDGVSVNEFAIWDESDLFVAGQSFGGDFFERLVCHRWFGDWSAPWLFFASRCGGTASKTAVWMFRTHSDGLPGIFGRAYGLSLVRLLLS